MSEGTEAARKALAASLRWVQKDGVWYLHDGAGQILGEVRRTSAGTVEAFYGVTRLSYIDIESARTALTKMASKIPEPPKKG